MKKQFIILQNLNYLILITKKSRELNKKLKLICNNFCDKSDRLKIEIENLSKK